MKPVYLVGRALASVLGLNLEQAISSLRSNNQSSELSKPLSAHRNTTYQRIPDQVIGWNARLRALIIQTAADAGAELARDGALFIATSCLDGDAAEQDSCDMDFHELSQRIGNWLDWRGPVFLVSSACNSSMQALLSAAEWLRASGETQSMVIGFELDNPLTLSGFAALQLLSQTYSKPFALQRDGLVLGEAVAALRLSTEQTAAWQLRGGANVVDGAQPTSSTATAVALMCQRALAASDLTMGDLDLIKVQASGSPSNDAIEAQGLRSAFAHLPALVSLKPLIGHCMGASGAAEIALLLECLEHDYWPRYPDITDPALCVRLASQRPPQLRHLLTYILGFGGIHTAVVLKQCQ